MMNIQKYSIAIFLVFVFFMFYEPQICFIIIGLLMLLYGIQYFLFFKNIQKNGIETKGRILSYQSDNEGYKTPIIEFKTLENLEVKKEPYYYWSTDLSKFKSYKNNINESVSILYDPKSPEKFIILKESKSNYVSVIFLGIFALIFITIGVFHLLGYMD